MKTALKPVAKTVIPAIMEGMGKMAVIALNDICVDPSYQRGSALKRAKKIGREWNWRIYSPISVSLRPDGRYYNFDGGHRAVAASLAGITHLPCYVVESAGAKEEAAAFVDLNDSRVRLKSIDKFRAMAVANDPICVFLEETFRTFKLEPVGDTRSGVGKINALGGLMNHFKGRKFDDARMDVIECLTVLQAAWGDQPLAFTGRVVEGMLRALSRIENRAALIREAADRLGRYEISEIKLRAERNAAVSGRPINAHMPEEIIERLNYRRKKKIA